MKRLLISTFIFLIVFNSESQRKRNSNTDTSAKKENIVLTDRYFYGSSNLEYINKESENNWFASDGTNRFKLNKNYLYISRIDDVGVKSISAFCKIKKFE